MAGIGPAPSDTRRRVNAPARGEWVDLEPLDAPVLPELPPLEDAEWSARSLATWAAWRSDPVTAQYTSADIAYALDAITLYEAMTPSSANEVRIRMDGLGLTPKGKRDLRWRVSGQAVAPTAARGSSRGSSERRSRLAAV